MRLLPIKPVLFMSACFFVLGCSQSSQTDTDAFNSEYASPNVIRFSWAPPSLETPQLKVINQFGDPVINAQILIGTAFDQPFAGNFLKTNTNGTVQIPTDWTTNAHVTIEATGYVRLTLLNQIPGDMTIRLSPAHLKQKPEIRGEVTQLPVVNGDKLVDFGLVMPALSRAGLLNFDIDQVLSPFSDSLTVAGQSSSVPTNLSLPTQKENFIFNFTLSKPIYRMPVPTQGPQRFVAISGNFIFKDVVSEIRKGKPFYELINYFSILGGSLRDTNLVQSVTNLNFSAGELEFKKSFQVVTPDAQPDEIIIVLAAAQLNDVFIPTDMKKSTGAQTLTLSSMAGKPPYIVNVIKKQSDFMTTAPGADRMSASLLPFTASAKQRMLPLVNDPTITTTNGYTIRLPASPTTKGIYPLAITTMLSDLIEVPDGSSTVTIASPRWEVVGLGWGSQIQLPKWPLNNPASKMRVGINFLGSNKNVNPILDDSLIEASTYVTHASTDF